MRIGTQIELTDVRKLLEKVFAASEVDVCTSDSEFGQRTQRFKSPDECFEYLQGQFNGGSKFVAFAAHYTEAKGHVEDRRVKLDPAKCQGHTFRYSVGGWGVIHLQFHKSGEDKVGCNITVNSEKRARVWYATYPELKEPALWNWKSVASHSRRLQRSLKALAQQSVQPDRREDAAPG